MTDYNETINETVDSVSTQGGVVNAYRTIAEAILGIDGGVISLPYQLVQENLSFVDSTLSDYLLTLSEKIIALSQDGNTIECSEILSEYLNLIDAIYIIYSNDISETFGLSTTITSIIYQIQDVVESLIASDNISTVTVFLTPIVELISVLDIIDYSIQKDIAESIIIDNLIVTLHNMINTISEVANLTDSFTNSYINIITLSENITNSSSTTYTSEFIEFLVDDFIITIGRADGQDTYLAYLFQPETSSTTTYTNYNFDGCVSVFNKYLFYSSTGLYEYGGSTDDGAKIVSDIQTAAISFGTSNLKSCPTLYLGYSSDGTTYLKVKVDGKADVTYKLNKKSHSLDTKKVSIGKGLVGRYFQYELISDSDLTIESIDLLPLVIKRKL